MAGTRKARVPMAEQIKLINECRQSGMIDADWCRENDIAVSTFYNWWIFLCGSTAVPEERNTQFVEGTNSKLKMVKRTMCRQPPLAAIRAILSGQTGTSPAINRYAAKGSLHE